MSILQSPAAGKARGRHGFAAGMASQPARPVRKIIRMCARPGAVPGNLARMNRRHFLHASVALSTAFAKEPASTPMAMDVRDFHSTRRFVELPGARVAYVERGRGPAAVFLHGYPLNGYQWRGALS